MTTNTRPLVGATVLVGEIESVVVALGDNGTAWIRSANGTERNFPMDVLTVVSYSTFTANLERFNQASFRWELVEIIENATMNQIRSAWETARRQDGYTYRVTHDACVVYLGVAGYHPA